MQTALLLTMLAVSTPQPDAQPRTPGTVQAPPVRAFLPQDEDWSTAGPDAPAFKGYRWTSDGSISTSVGIDARLHVETYQNEAFGGVPGSDESVFLLATPWASISFNDRIRIYGALKHASVQGRDGPKPGAISDTVDLHQGFLEVAVGDALGQSRKDLLVRVGRQELHYGAGRVLAIRAGRFMRDDYDGALVRYRRGQWVTDAFGFVAVEDGTDAFDNGTDDKAKFSGIYSSGRLKKTNLDLYSLRWQREDIATLEGLSDITRNYAGARAYGTALEQWEWDVEGTLQFGSVEATNQDIQGFQIGGRVSRSFGGVRGAPSPTI